MTTPARWLAVALLCSACDVDDDRAATILALDADPLSGADVYDAECASCHGLEGEGGVGPTMAAAVEGQDQDDLVHVLLEGVGDMPSQDHLSDQDLADVVRYIDETW